MDFAKARANMVDCQVRTNKVTDALLIRALRAVPRDEFVPKAMRPVAYADEDLHIGDGRYLMEPMVLARLIQALEIGADDMVLDIGGASGYSAALMARLACAVVAVDSDAGLVDTAGRVLQQIDINNVVTVAGGLQDGYPKQAPYNGVLFQGAIDRVPPAVMDQVADGGRVAFVERAGPGPGRAVVLARRGDVTTRRILFDAAVPMLPAFEPEPGFVF